MIGDIRIKMYLRYICNIVRPSRILFILGLRYFIWYLFLFGVRCILGLQFLIGLVGLSVGLVGYVFLFVGGVLYLMVYLNDNQVYRITGISSMVFISFSVLICFGYVGAC